MKILYIVISFLFCLTSSNSYAEIISYNGKYKVHNDTCYEQINKHSSKTIEWSEFNCITHLENAHLNEEILNHIYAFYNFKNSGLISEKAFVEIINSSMLALSMKSSFNNKTIIRNLVEFSKEAQKKYPIK